MFLFAIGIAMLFEWVLNRGSAGHSVEHPTEESVELVRDWEEVSKAEIRARRLLFQLFGAKALDEYLNYGTVTVKDRLLRWRYRVSQDGVVVVTNWNGSCHLCIAPVGGYPAADRVISLALLARSSPRKLIRTAGDGGPWASMMYQRELAQMKE